MTWLTTYAHSEMMVLLGVEILSCDGNANHVRSHDINSFEVTYRAVLTGVVATDASVGKGNVVLSLHQVWSEDVLPCFSGIESPVSLYDRLQIVRNLLGAFPAVRRLPSTSATNTVMPVATNVYLILHECTFLS
jgi:hypothetical protein